MATGQSAYRYALAPYTWVTAGTIAHWRQPAPAVGAVDLRPLAAQAAAGGTPSGYAFVPCLQSPGAVDLAAGLHMNGIDSTTGMRDAWESATGYRPVGATLTDLLWDQLTTGADPTGEAGPKPLMPGTDGQLKLFVGGHSLVKAERFAWGAHPHTNRVRDVLRRDFEREWEQSGGHDHCRRVLDFTCKKFKVDDWRDFVPARLHAHVPGRLPHATTITESFNQADSSTLGPDLSWTEILGDVKTVSNKAVGHGSTENVGRANSDLSSDDHYCQVVITNVSAGTSSNCGPMTRKDSSATLTYYLAIFERTGDLWKSFKSVGGSFTNIGSNTNLAASESDTIKLETDGSNITRYRNGASQDATTDAAITGNLRCGFMCYAADAIQADSFEAADLAAGGRTTKNTRAWPLGMEIGMGWRMPV
jgi:hypothetical protein